MLHPFSAFVALNLTTALALLSTGAVQAQPDRPLNTTQRVMVNNSTRSPGIDLQESFPELSQFSQRQRASFPDVSEASWAAEAIFSSVKTMAVLRASQMAPIEAMTHLPVMPLPLA